jgi:hypothetical protein
MRAARTGAITFVQRFGGLVNLNVHFHLVVPDGVFVDAEDRLVFALHPVPTSAYLLAILDRIVRRVTLGSPTRHATTAWKTGRRARPGSGRGSGDVARTPQRQANCARCRASARLVRHQSFSIFCTPAS